jgi:hypothetical protein
MIASALTVSIRLVVFKHTLVQLHAVEGLSNPYRAAIHASPVTSHAAVALDADTFHHGAFRNRNGAAALARGVCGQIAARQDSELALEGGGYIHVQVHVSSLHSV